MSTSTPTTATAISAAGTGTLFEGHLISGPYERVFFEPENRVKLPDFIQATRIMYVVDDIDAVYRKAEAAGIPVLQPRTENTMGAQGRLELAPGCIVELAEATTSRSSTPTWSRWACPPPCAEHGRARRSGNTGRAGRRSPRVSTDQHDQTAVVAAPARTGWRTSRPALLLLTAVAPLLWSTTYIVTETALPPDRPLFGALLRALPIGLVMLAWRRTLPPAGWRVRTVVLGMLNIGLFFPLIYLSAYNLPGGLAATVQALLPMVVMVVAYLLLRERPTVFRVTGAVIGFAGVALLVLGTTTGVTVLGLAAAAGSVLCTAVGSVLTKRWQPPVDMVTLVSWQLVVGGLFLLPVALLVEGAAPHLDAKAVAGYLWIGVIGTGLAYVCWFAALRLMPAGSVALVSLVNPVSATVLGVAFAGEAFGLPQAVGMALVLGGVALGQVVRRPGLRRS
ncbi:MAG: EamA family transporter [Nocardioides sp.]|uniref:EamA family transporter n=1 Tax=Nocardioides sp. TaxID=35761 RepID=UPI003F072FD3